jgi:hypothetical protein
MRLAFVAILLSALIVASARSASAQDKTVPCWRTVILDWADNGRLDKPYPRTCYRQALRRLRAELEIYSNAREEIERALFLASAPGKPPHDPFRPGATDAAPAARRHLDTVPYANGSLADRLDLLLSRQRSSTPIPLYVLGGIALLLLAAGGTGVVVGRMKRA